MRPAPIPSPRLAAVALLALAAPACARSSTPAAASPSPAVSPAPSLAPSIADTAYFAVVLGTDTLGTERTIRTATRLDGELRMQRPRVTTVRYTMYLRADAAVDSMRTQVGEGSGAQRGMLVFGRDSAILTVYAGEATTPRVDRSAVAPGTLPFINLSSGVLDQVFRRARRIGGDSATVPLFAGAQALPGRVRFVGADSAVLDVGVALRAAVGPDGAFRGALVPSQNVRFVRLTTRPASHGAATGAPAADRYAAPAGAPYTAEEVTIRTPSGLALAGTLTLPRGASRARPAPVVVTITGSGPQNRDSEIMGIAGYRFFGQVADTLGRRGVGVLRLDDRGTGASDAGPASATSADLAGDVRAALAWLHTRPEVSGLALLGHSEGGMIAPMVAAEDTTVRAVVLMAAPSRPGHELSAHQRRVAIDSDARIAAAARDSVMRVAQAHADSMVRTGEAGAWTRYWWSFDPRPVVKRLRMPVLILHGETDLQVPVAQGDELAAMLRASGNRDVTVRRFAARNHLFLADTSGHWDGYASLPSKVVAPDVTGAIADWLAARLVPAR